MKLSEKYGYDLYQEHFHFDTVFRDLSDVPNGIDRLNFWRKKDSHQGISNYQEISHLTASAVNDSFLAEICNLKKLDSLVLANIEVEDLNVLMELPNLRYLRVEKLRACKGLDCLVQIPNIKKLWIGESKEITDFQFVKGAKSIRALGIVGAIWTKQKVESLEPISDMPNLEALFMPSVQLKDKNLNYVATNPKLKYFAVSRFAPKKSFEELKKIRPDLICQWFDQYEL